MIVIFSYYRSKALITFNNLDIRTVGERQFAGIVSPLLPSPSEELFAVTRIGRGRSCSATVVAENPFQLAVKLVQFRALQSLHYSGLESPSLLKQSSLSFG